MHGVRQAALDALYAQHPDRFPNGPPQAALPPAEVHINPLEAVAVPVNAQAIDDTLPHRGTSDGASRRAIRRDTKRLGPPPKPFPHKFSYRSIPTPHSPPTVAMVIGSQVPKFGWHTSPEATSHSPLQCTAQPGRRQLALTGDASQTGTAQIGCVATGAKAHARNAQVLRPDLLAAQPVGARGLATVQNLIAIRSIICLRTCVELRPCDAAAWRSGPGQTGRRPKSPSHPPVCRHRRSTRTRPRQA